MIHDAVSNRMPWAKDGPSGLSELLAHEWLVTNGLGGYAAGTVAGVSTRRFHGLLVAALPAPLGRVMMLNSLAEELRLPDGAVADFAKGVVEFRLEQGLPVWRFKSGAVVVEKSLVMPHLQNTVYIRYRMVEGSGGVRLRVRPSMRFRPHEGRVDSDMSEPYTVTSHGRRISVEGPPDIPALRILPYGERASFVLDGGRFLELAYPVEQARGYDARGRVWSPGYVKADLVKGAHATFAASTESWEAFAAMPPDAAFDTEHLRRRRLVDQAAPQARTGPAAEWVLAADQFVITPNTRVVHAARARASGDDIRSVVAGYHWFTDWGRDTMIALEGLTLCTGRRAEAGYILRMFGDYVRDGLLPNFFPEGESEGVYHTADATLWFFHALDRYLSYGEDRATLKLLLPKLEEIVAKHVEGTRFGIGVDPSDWLLRQGQDGYQLTWMDAKVDGWVVTPRRGKAVELNALWYNALRLLSRWTSQERGGDAGAPYAAAADRVRASFNERFWNEKAGCLYDVLDGDPAEAALIRPNQLFAISLPHPVLDQSRWKAVLTVVARDLITPVGLRSLSPREPGYKKTYHGDLRTRDAAYHQGTVWAWLIGPYLDAYLKANPGKKKEARALLQGFVPHLGQACLGSISEIFDAEPPYLPRGCVAQAWSVAEVLRTWILTAE